jgi:hypothetical protein
VNEVPSDVLEESPFGTLKISASRLDGNKLRVTGRLVMAKARITAKEYGAYRAWLMRVDQAFSRKLAAQQGGQTASR